MFKKKNEIIDISNNPDTSSVTPAKKPSKKKNQNVFSRIARWFRELKSELKKIVWPTWHTVVKNTSIVLGCIVAFGIVLWIFDYLAGQGASALIHAVNK
ncbi:MAG: preprotein translocase subunit SecE [Clostridiales bacterium]|jgi:preprotein translocase subunit SecE|nr:preprotein translocase subunit SecE [Clostridiales bacterium]